MSTTATNAAALLRDHGPLPPELVVEIVTAVADQLNTWASEGLAYGTAQPAEIEVLLDSELLVAASLTGFPSPPEVLTPSVLLSNARYIDPELLSGNVFGPSADTYALACAAYQLLTGTTPFAGVTVAETMARAGRGAVPATDLPGDLGVVLATALAVDPLDRYESAGELAVALRRATRSR